MGKILPELLSIRTNRGREAFMSQAVCNLPIVDKDQAEQDISLLRRHVRIEAEGLYVDGLATEAQDGNPIISTVAIGKIRDELRAIAAGTRIRISPGKNWIKPHNK